MKKVMILLLVCFLLVPIVNANQVTVPVNFIMSVTFQNTTSFQITMPFGFQRYYTWGNGTQPPNDNVNYTYYATVDQSTWCPDVAAQMEQFKNISYGVLSVANSCNEVLAGFNSSYGFNGILWTTQMQRIEKSENDSKIYQDQYNNCQSNLINAQTTANKYTQCDADLKSANSNKILFLFLGGAGGLALGYYQWGRKKGGRPEEQQNAGFTGDEIPQRG